MKFCETFRFRRTQLQPLPKKNGRVWLNRWFSRRCIWALALCAGVFAIGGISPPMVWLGAAALLLLFGAVVVDLAIGPRSAEIFARRLESGHFSLRALTRLRYSIVNRSRRAVSVGLLESPVPQLAVCEAEITALIPARSQIELSRAVLPRLRGPAKLGALYLWYENALGLIRRRVRLDAEQEIRVYPDLSLVQRYGKLHVRNRVLEAGLRKMRLRGGGTEIESLREWSSGDQFRAINWKASARRGKLIVTHYEVERAQNVMLLLDCGRLMTARIDQQRKCDYAITAALSVAAIADLTSDRVGFVAFANQILRAGAPRSGKRGLAHLCQELYDLEPRFEESDYARAFLYVRAHLQKRSLVVLFTDLFDPVSAATILRDIGVLARRHLVVCVLMSDAAIENAITSPPLVAADVYRAGVAAALADERRSAALLLARGGILVVDVPAPKLTIALIDAYLDIKRRGSL